MKGGQNIKECGRNSWWNVAMKEGIKEGIKGMNDLLDNLSPSFSSFYWYVDMLWNVYFRISQLLLRHTPTGFVILSESWIDSRFVALFLIPRYSDALGFQLYSLQQCQHLILFMKSRIILNSFVTYCLICDFVGLMDWFSRTVFGSVFDRHVGSSEPFDKNVA